MFRLQGPKCKDLCDTHLPPTRRDVLRVGGSGLLGLSLGSMFQLQARSAESKGSGRHAGLEQSQEHYHGLPARWTKPLGSMGSEGRCARECQERFQVDSYEIDRSALHREPADAG